MNNLKLQILFLLCLIIGFTSCKKDEPKSDLDKQKEAISASWEVQTATVGGDNVDFEKPVTIIFSTNETFNIENLGSLDAANLNLDGVLKASGNWEITEGNLQLVNIGDGNTINITQLNENSFNFNYSSSYPKESDNTQTITISSSKVE